MILNLNSILLKKLYLEYFLKEYILAGTPETIAYSGTFLVTTAPAATTQPLPNVTPPSILAPAPTQQSSEINIGLAVNFEW